MNLLLHDIAVKIEREAEERVGGTAGATPYCRPCADDSQGARGDRDEPARDSNQA